MKSTYEPHSSNIAQELPENLVCPENRTPLKLVPGAAITALNAAIAAGQLRNRAGLLVETPLGGGLLRQDGMFLYPIVEHIPILLADEAIPTQQSCITVPLTE